MAVVDSEGHRAYPSEDKPSCILSGLPAFSSYWVKGSMASVGDANPSYSVSSRVFLRSRSFLSICFLLDGDI